MMMVHDVEFADDLEIVLKHTLPAVKKLVNDGKARFMGISGYPLSVLKQVIDESGIEIDFVLTYCRDTLIDNTLQQYIPYFQEKDIGVVNGGCLAMGLLSNTGPMSWHPATENIKSLCKSAVDYCKTQNVELGRLALRHSLDQPGSATCLVGVNNLQHLKTNLDVLHNGLSKIEQEVLTELKERFFVPGCVYHWEGVEVKRHREKKSSEQE